MLKHKSFILFFSVLFALFYLKGQAQDTLQIDEVIKTESRFYEYKNSNEEIIDSILKSLYKNSSIDELLFIQTSSQIKSYGGLGNLSSIVLRGSGANHVSVNWNGFPINSGTTGGTDLSMIQSGFFETIKVIPGASSSLYGSGTFGGAIELNNFSEGEKGLLISLGSENGSFNTAKYFVQGDYSDNKLQYKISLNKINAENDFPFYDSYKIESPLELREHNSLNSFNTIQTIKLKLPKNNTIESGVWYLIKEKEIPEIAGSYEAGNKKQTDSVFRSYIRWQKVYKQSMLSVSSAFFSEYLHYTDKINSTDTFYDIDSEIKSNTVFGDISYRYYFNNKLTIDFAGIINYQKIITPNYINDKIEDVNYSFLTALKYNVLDFDFKFSFRNEFSDEAGYIPLFDFGFAKGFFKDKLILKSSMSNKFRRPTFNERYWQPGGNPDIKYETGNSAETTVEYILKEGSDKTLRISATGYYSKINNMIQWIPDNGVWTAINNNEVTSSGLESNFHYTISKKNFKHSVITSYNYTNSKLTDVYSDTELETAVKLIYTPEHSSKVFFTSAYKKFSLSFTTQYTGRRFTTQDNNSDYTLSAFVLSNLYAAYQFDMKIFNISLNAKLFNIFNTQYEMIKSYPSPGRAVYFSVVFRYKNNGVK